MLQFKRGKRKVLADYAISDIYNFYTKMAKNSDKIVDRKLFKDIFKEFADEIVNMLVFENLDYTMPAGLGHLQIKKRKVAPRLDKNGELDARGIPVDYKKTKEYWSKLYPDKTPEEIRKIKGKPLIRELNSHTDGNVFSFSWDKTTSLTPNQTAYILKLTRKHQRLLAKAAKTVKDLDYYEI